MSKSQGMKIGLHEFQLPIIQGGMGIGISLTNLCIASSNAGFAPVAALVGTGGYKNPNIKLTPNTLTSLESIKKIVRDIRSKIGNKPLYCNIMYALTKYDQVAEFAIEAGFDGIITGAGTPVSLPGIIGKNKSISMVPIVSTVKSFENLMTSWEKEYGRIVIPNAIVIEGPKAGGHLGFIRERELDKDENQLESQIPKIMEFMKDNGLNIPSIGAGGISYSSDIKKMLDLGCVGVQIGTRFLGTFECDASDYHKKLLIESTIDDIIIGKSPAGLPCRKLFNPNETKQSDIICKVNCLKTCKKGKRANKVKYCIADSLQKGIEGKADGLYMVGANGYKINKLISVQQLADELVAEL